MVEIIMPDGTFLSSIISSGAGDFMADGSVPMTGDLSIDKATPVIELDTSATSSMIKFLQATVLKGQIWTSNNYFMMKSYAGDLQIVGPSSVGMNIDFITNDVTRFRIEDSTLTAVVPLAMSSYKITGLAAPTTDYDGATKKYVDDNVGGAGDFMANGSVPMTGDLSIDKASPVIELDTSATSSFLKLSQASTVRGQLWASDTILMLKSMTGDLQLISASSAGKKIDFITNDVTRFRIEDAAATLAVPLAMSDNKITGLAAPTVNGNALRYEHLTADDHTQYLLINGTRAMTGNLMLNMASPVIELDTSATSAFLKFSQASAIKGQIWTSNDYFMMKSMVDDLQLSSASSAGKTIDFITNDVTRFRIADSELATTVPLAMGGNKITGLATPTTDYDGATKKYVDDNIGAGGDFMADGSVPMTGDLSIDKASPVIELDTSATSSFLKLSQASVVKGQIWTSNNYLMVKSMTDDLQLISASSAGKKIDFITNDVTRFRIEDAAATLAVSLAMGSNKITGLATPTASTDATTKGYADALPGTNAATFKINQDNVGTEASALEFDRGSAATAARIHWSEINDRFTFESVKTSTLAEVRTLQLDVQDQINLDDTVGTVMIKKNDSTGDMELQVASGDSIVFKAV